MGSLIECVNPFRQIMKVLAVTVPFEAFIDHVIRRSFGERLADPQAADRWVLPSRVLVEAADPAFADIVASMPAQHEVHLINELACKFTVARLVESAREGEQVTDGERIGPEIPARLAVAGQTGSNDEIVHEFARPVDRVLLI
ncbi:MAG: hypothetical protein V3T53_15550 [Phycisphaerales bacterium]